MNQFQKEFLHFCRNKTFGSVFTDFLTIVLCSLALGKEEELYLEIISRYTKEEVRTEIPKLFALLVNIYEKEVTACGSWCDPLGELFEAYSSMKGKQMSGQFFTPISVCNMTAQMTMAELPEKDKLNISDCAAGSGRMLIAASRTSPEMNAKCSFHAVDLDRQCSMMTAINFFFHGMKGVSIHGNSLSLEAFGGWKIKPYVYSVERLSAEQAKTYLFQSNLNKEDKTTNQNVVLHTKDHKQLKLF